MFKLSVNETHCRLFFHTFKMRLRTCSNRISSDLFSLNPVFVQRESQFAEVYNRHKNPHIDLSVQYLTLRNKWEIIHFVTLNLLNLKRYYRNFMHRCCSLKRGFPIVDVVLLLLSWRSENLFYRSLFVIEMLLYLVFFYALCNLASLEIKIL